MTKRKKCRCGRVMNVAYIYKRVLAYGRWKPIGFYCDECGAFAHTKNLKLSEGVRTSVSLRKDERKRV